MIIWISYGLDANAESVPGQSIMVNDPRGPDQLDTGAEKPRPSGRWMIHGSGRIK